MYVKCSKDFLKFVVFNYVVKRKVLDFNEMLNRNLKKIKMLECLS